MAMASAVAEDKAMAAATTVAMVKAKWKPKELNWKPKEIN